ncbi:MAG: hypothetical protein E6R04_09755 [Spirochaetes bacterium]|nr:MAG: hypothetical protein E6R04_09755 [Spirochaetota bacterium]
MSSGFDFTTVGTTVKAGRVLTVQACPNCANIADDHEQQRLVRLVEYTLLHKILSWLSGHGWPLNRWDMKEYTE